VKHEIAVQEIGTFSYGAFILMSQICFNKNLKTKTKPTEFQAQKLHQIFHEISQDSYI
jgi:hypothetical protein